MLGGVDVGDGAAAGHAGDPVAEQVAAGDQDAGRPGPADELVGRDEDGVESRLGHVDPHVGGGRGEVPEGERSVVVEQRADRPPVGDDPGDVGGGREAADLERPAGVTDQLLLQVAQVDVPVGVLVDDDHVGDRLAPGQLVGVVLVGPDEDDRPLRGRDPLREPVAVVEVGRDAQVEHVDQPVDRAGRAGAAEDHGVLLGRADRPRMISRASSRKRVVWRPVPDDSVCVLA